MTDDGHSREVNPGAPTRVMGMMLPTPLLHLSEPTMPPIAETTKMPRCAVYQRPVTSDRRRVRNRVPGLISSTAGGDVDPMTGMVIGGTREYELQVLEPRDE